MTAIEFNHQITLHYPSLFALTKRFTKSDEDSWDLIQETVTKAISNRNRFKDNTNLKGWLFTIMRNIFINNYRKEKQRQTYFDSSVNQYQLQKADHHTFYNPLQNYHFDELNKLINQLPSLLLKPFTMHYEGYKYHEIADELNIPIGTVKNRIFQARKSIQAKLKH